MFLKRIICVIIFILLISSFLIATPGPGAKRREILLGINEKHHPPDMQGYDITPILMNPATKIRDCCFIENDEEIGSLKSRLRHLITEDYKLTIYEDVPGFGDIYDRKNDPDELNNIF